MALLWLLQRAGATVFILRQAASSDGVLVGLRVPEKTTENAVVGLSCNIRGHDGHACQGAVRTYLWNCKNYVRAYVPYEYAAKGALIAAKRCKANPWETGPL